MSHRVSSWVWEQAMPPSEKLVLLRLADHANPDGGDVYPSVASVAEYTGISERQVQRYLKGFVERGILVITGHAKGGRNNPREYQFTFKFRPKKGDTDDTVSGRERVTRMTPIDDRKGVAHDTVSERVTSEKGDTHDAERVTPMTRKGDTAMSPEPSRTVNEPDSLPRNGPAQTIVAVLYEDVLGIGKPTNYRKVVGQAQQLVDAGVTPDDIPDAVKWCEGQKWLGGSFDLGTILSQADKWRAYRRQQEQPKIRRFVV